MQQIFINDKFEIGKYYALDANQKHHLVDVLRYSDGKTIKVVDQDKNWSLVSLKINTDDCGFTIESLNASSSIGSTILVMALIKKDKWDLTLTKACELGVDEIYPLVSRRTVVRLDEKSFKKERYLKIIESACSQCKRNDMPLLHDPLDIHHLPSFDGYTKLLAYENEDGLGIWDISLSENNVIVIGPEGGFDPNEVEAFNQQGYIPVSLGSTILRAETAALFVLSAIKLHKEALQ